MPFSCPLDTPSSQGLCVCLHVSQALWGHTRGLWVDKVYGTSLSPLGRRSMIMILSLELGQQAQRGKITCARPRDGAERVKRTGNPPPPAFPSHWGPVLALGPRLSLRPVLPLSRGLTWTRAAQAGMITGIEANVRPRVRGQWGFPGGSGGKEPAC